MLKAYLIGFMFYSMKFVVDLAERVDVANNFRDVHIRLKSLIYNYIVPKNLGHALSGFMEKFLPFFFEAYCSGRLLNYVNATLKSLTPLIKDSKEHLIKNLMLRGATKEVAEKAYGLLYQVFTQKPALITVNEDVKVKSCSEAEKNFGVFLRAPKEWREPCLKATTLLIEYVKNLAEEAYTQAISDYKELLNKSIGELLESSKLSNILPKKILEEAVEDYLRITLIGNIIIIMAFPLHFCLFKYYDAVRYGEGAVPQEEFDAIPEAINTLEYVYEMIKTLLSLSSYE